ncbi:MAG: polysaccharide deacetylase family protein [Alphaproteobacteria bacterium]|nr:polysaccharide deacetylase family protein [Alphaproteobacteria bacterium]
MASDATRILMFHRILGDASAVFDLPSCYRMRGTALTVPEFLRVVEDAGPVLRLEAVECALAAGERLPHGSVLTFDDGYREHLDVVAPLLAARGVSATFYVATGLHGEASDVAVVDAWYWLLDHAAGRVARVPLPGGGEHRGRVDTYECKTAWVEGEPKARLLAATPAQQAAMVAALADSVGCALPADLAARLYLRPSEWAALVGLGMRVGAHSVSHPRLTQVDDETLRAEVEGSVSAVRQLGGQVAFAYPDGAYDERVVREVSRAAVSSSATCEPGMVGRGDDLLRLSRVFVSTPRAGP